MWLGSNFREALRMYVAQSFLRLYSVFLLQSFLLCLLRYFAVCCILFSCFLLRTRKSVRVWQALEETARSLSGGGNFENPGSCFPVFCFPVFYFARLHDMTRTREKAFPAPAEQKEKPRKSRVAVFLYYVFLFFTSHDSEIWQVLEETLSRRSLSGGETSQNAGSCFPVFLFAVSYFAWTFATKETESLLLARLRIDWNLYSSI